MNRHYQVLGLDLSLTSTGYSYRSYPQVGSRPDIVTGRITPNHLKGVARLAYLRDQLLEVVSAANYHDWPLTLAVIEGYSMGSPFRKGQPASRPFSIGEWGGVARLALWERGVKTLIISPSSLKMFATGNGAAKKPEVMAAIPEVWGYAVEQDDEADAFVAMMYGEAWSSRRAARRYDAKRLRALDKYELIEK